MSVVTRRAAITRGLRFALLPSAVAALAFTPGRAAANPAAAWLARILPVISAFIAQLAKNWRRTRVVRRVIDANRRRAEVWVECVQPNGQTFIMICEVNGEQTRYYRR